MYPHLMPLSLTVHGPAWGLGGGPAAGTAFAWLRLQGLQALLEAAAGVLPGGEGALRAALEQTYSQGERRRGMGGVVTWEGGGRLERRGREQLLEQPAAASQATVQQVVTHCIVACALLLCPVRGPPALSCCLNTPPPPPLTPLVVPWCASAGGSTQLPGEGAAAPSA
jgi:hypothetical protein